jgi:hypothetical protein
MRNVQAAINLMAASVRDAERDTATLMTSNRAIEFWIKSVSGSISGDR